MLATSYILLRVGASVPARDVSVETCERLAMEGRVIHVYTDYRGELSVRALPGYHGRP